MGVGYAIVLVWHLMDWGGWGGVYAVLGVIGWGVGVLRFAVMNWMIG